MSPFSGSANTININLKRPRPASTSTSPASLCSDLPNLGSTNKSKRPHRIATTMISQHPHTGHTVSNTLGEEAGGPDLTSTSSVGADLGCVDPKEAGGFSTEEASGDSTAFSISPSSTSSPSVRTAMKSTIYHPALISTMPYQSSTAEVDDDEVVIRPRKDKGKGKMRYLPDLPEEVWRRIWGLYYDQCAAEWHDHGVMHHALAPLLLSTEHTRSALPVLYIHPHISHHTIPAFLRALLTPSRYISTASSPFDPPQVQSRSEADPNPTVGSTRPAILVRHLTIRPSPVPPLPGNLMPNWEPILPSSLPQLFSNLPNLITLHLKDTLILNPSDADTLFSSLSRVSPLKARLEIRMWDLTDSIYGEDLIAATRPSIHAAMTKSPLAPPPLAATPGSAALQRSVSERNRLQMDAGKHTVQEMWRDALWKGVDLDLPPWWIEIPRNEINAGQQGGGGGGGGGPGGGGAGGGGWNGGGGGTGGPGGGGAGGAGGTAGWGGGLGHLHGGGSAPTGGLGATDTGSLWWQSNSASGINSSTANTTINRFWSTGCVPASWTAIGALPRLLWVRSYLQVHRSKRCLLKRSAVRDDPMVFLQRVRWVMSTWSSSRSEGEGTRSCQDADQGYTEWRDRPKLRFRVSPSVCKAKSILMSDFFSSPGPPTAATTPPPTLSAMSLRPPWVKQPRPGISRARLDRQAGIADYMERYRNADSSSVGEKFGSMMGSGREPVWHDPHRIDHLLEYVPAQAEEPTAIASPSAVTSNATDPGTNEAAAASSTNPDSDQTDADPELPMSASGQKWDRILQGGPFYLRHLRNDTDPALTSTPMLGPGSSTPSLSSHAPLLDEDDEEMLLSMLEDLGSGQEPTDNAQAGAGIRNNNTTHGSATASSSCTIPSPSRLRSDSVEYGVPPTIPSAIEAIHLPSDTPPPPPGGVQSSMADIPYTFGGVLAVGSDRRDVISQLRLRSIARQRVGRAGRSATAASAALGSGSASIDLTVGGVDETSVGTPQLYITETETEPEPETQEQAEGEAGTGLLEDTTNTDVDSDWDDGSVARERARVLVGREEHQAGALQSDSPREARAELARIGTQLPEVDDQARESSVLIPASTSHDHEVSGGGHAGERDQRPTAAANRPHNDEAGAGGAVAQSGPVQNDHQLPGHSTSALTSTANPTNPPGSSASARTPKQSKASSKASKTSRPNRRELGNIGSWDFDSEVNNPGRFGAPLMDRGIGLTRSLPQIGHPEALRPGSGFGSEVIIPMGDLGQATDVPAEQAAPGWRRSTSADNIVTSPAQWTRTPIPPLPLPPSVNTNNTASANANAIPGSYHNASGQEMVNMNGRRLRILRPPPDLDTGNRFNGPSSNGTRADALTRRLNPLPYMPGHHLAHAMQRQLRALITEHWSPTIQALSIVAFDPLASLIVRSPTLDFWTRVPVPHVRVHLPRAVNSLAVFKGKEENARDRRKNRVETGAATTPLSPIIAITGPNSAAEDIEREDRVVGGDGRGGRLVSDETKLFEIEVNTIREMSDDVWVMAGGQLPPQLCRILVGEQEQDWGGVRYRSGMGGSEGVGMTVEEDEEDEGDGEADSEGGDESVDFGMDGSDDAEEDDDGEDEEIGAGTNTYDKAAAEEQARKLRERKLARMLVRENDGQSGSGGA